MKRQTRSCPVSWYIGNLFAKKRKELGWSKDFVADKANVSTQYISLFENGKLQIDVLFLLKMETIVNLAYQYYKPPVSYFGFLGLYGEDRDLLLLSKKVIKRLKRSSVNKRSSRDIENAFLKLRYSPLKGKRPD